MIDLSSLLSAWFLLPAGMFAGFLAGLFGVGGGIVIVPTVFYFLSYLGMHTADAMPVAVCTSLCSIIPTSVSSALSHWRLGHIDTRLVRLWAIPLFIGVLLGTLAVSFIRSTAFAAIFGGTLLLVACHKGLIGRNLQPVPKAAWLHYPAAAIVGLLSSLAGVGGGATGVPILTYLGTSTRSAIGTCSVFGLLVALPATLLVLLFSESPIDAPEGLFRLLYWPALFFLLPATVMFAPLGAWVNSKLSETFLHYAFLLILITIGSRMLWHGLSG